MRISSDGYGSKIPKVSRGRPTVSNGTVLATKQEFFFTRVTYLQETRQNVETNKHTVKIYKRR